ncbi:MAG TPA: class I SAM-dependent methyltransferase, partial [Polyangia bacterium]
ARPAARLCDLGCGLAMLAVLLKERGARAAVTALDWDAGKLAIARAAAAGLDGLELRAHDLTTDPLPACDAAALVDVLHYHPPAAQDALLGRVAAALAPGGRLVIRDVDLAGGMRVGRALERFAARLGWHRTAGVFHYRPAAELAAVLTRLGLTVAVQPAGGLLTRANVLLTADRPAPT